MKKSLPTQFLVATDDPRGGAATAAASAQFPLPGWPLFRLGFRPFYLGAAAFALFAVPYWIAGLQGLVALPSTMPPLLWHAHEMLYGFAVAVIVGFLLTAGKAWTGLATPRGVTLAVMAGLWLAARLAALGAPYAIYAVLDVALLPWVAFVLIRLLVKAGNRRNLPLGAILMLLATANVTFHAAVLGWLNIDALRAVHAGLALVVMIECVIAGRVIPAFTMSALPGRQLKVPAWLERGTLAATALALASWVLLPANPVTAAGFALAALLHAARLWHWQPWRTRARPILWVLHAAYAWLPVGFALLAAAQGGEVAASIGIHALAVGATGGLIIGMVTRTARGHTGRLLQASRLEVAAYGLVAVAAIARVLLPLVVPAHAADGLVVAAAAWAAAFALYLWTFAPWLLRSRLDGKDG
ncbi:MAG: NnrS family protein [Burkholderiaceae bacterium]|nr:NnrS family protein [Rhodoferax sp.]MCP5284023.1 NnrS family protein [Burkholderiaceae bacterium]